MSAVRPTLLQRVKALAVISSCFIVIYSGTSWFTGLRTDAGTAVFSWEHYIPFVPWLIIPYWSLDLFFIGSVFVCRTTEELQVLVRRLVTATVIAGICFLLFPLRIVFERPQLTGIQEFLFGVLDQAKDFYNAAPSLHIAIRSILWTVYIPASRGILRRSVQAWFILIGCSTLLCWRHHVIDVIAGQMLSLAVIHLIAAQTFSSPEVNLVRGVNSSLRLGLRYIGGALCSLLAAVYTWPYGILFLWPMLALLLAAAAYLGCGPAVFRKTKGRIRPASRLLLAPYLAGAHLSFRYFSAGREAYRQFSPGVWLGRRLKETEALHLGDLGVMSVLDLTAEYEENDALLALNYRNIPVLDLTSPSTAQLEEAVQFIRQAKTQGGVYIHCSLGRSRSALAAAAYLLAEGLVNSADSAISEVKRFDAVIKPEWREALVEFETTLSTSQAA